MEINVSRDSLENMVEQRTKELQEALTDLKERDLQIQKQWIWPVLSSAASFPAG